MRNAGTLVISSPAEDLQISEPRSLTLVEIPGFVPKGHFPISLLVGDIIYLNNIHTPPHSVI